MRNFNLKEVYDKVITNSNIISLISKIHEYKGKEEYLLSTKKDTLETLLKVAKIESTSSSNKIEGISTTDKRIKEIVVQKLEFMKITDILILIKILFYNYIEIYINILAILMEENLKILKII